MYDTDQPLFDLKATVNKQAVLSILDQEGNVLSYKKIEKNQQRSTFTYQGESITWMCEIIKPKDASKRGYLLVYLYPVNLQYAANPIKVEEV